jgi:hypothetical protein
VGANLIIPPRRVFLIRSWHPSATALDTIYLVVVFELSHRVTWEWKREVLSNERHEEVSMDKVKGQELRYRVFNPLGYSAAGGSPSDSTLDEETVRARRLDGIDNRIIYLVDVGFGGGYEFLKEMQGWFSRNRPLVTTVLRRKRGNMFLDDPDLWAEIKQKGDAAVLGVGG